MPFDIAVVGSLNHDLTILAPRHPGPGETVLGHRHQTGAGGKGANQAVAAARLGSRVVMVGRVGDDANGRSLISRLQAEGVDVGAIITDPEAPTGLAVITVDDHGENSIVVSPGANSNLRPADVYEAADAIGQSGAVLGQLEVPLETVIAAARVTTGAFILNTAPARELPADLLASVDVLVANRSELGVLANTAQPETMSQVIEAARRIEIAGALVVTLGSEGAIVLEDDESVQIEAPTVDAVDTTGAGDAFCGALATALAKGTPLVDAATRACAAGALAATRPGAQAAMPTIEGLEAVLAR